MIGSRVAENITKEKILSLKLGMNKEEIIKILGNPIKTDYNNGNWLIYTRLPRAGCPGGDVGARGADRVPAHGETRQVGFGARGDEGGFSGRPAGGPHQSLFA